MKKKDWEFTQSYVGTMCVVIALLSHFYPHETGHSSGHVNAYLDPGTGSMIISAIIGISATIVLGFKTFGYKLLTFFKPRSKRSDEAHGDKPPEKP